MLRAAKAGKVAACVVVVLAVGYGVSLSRSHATASSIGSVENLPDIPLSQNGWQYFRLTAIGPALMFYRADRSVFVMGCKNTSFSFHVRGFTPLQRWPQPQLTVSIGNTGRSKLPDLRLVGTQTAFETDFPIADSVLKAVRVGDPITARFAGRKLRFPALPEGMRREFTDKCEALVPAGMRAG